MKEKSIVQTGKIAWRWMLIAGPCSAESEEQVMQTAGSLAAIDPEIIFRAGIWKPRTRPGAFEGKGKIALPWMQRVRNETGLRTATEVANSAHVEECLKFGIDILWIGARTTGNPFSVQEIADALRGTGIPVLVKNPVSPDIQLWIGAIERIRRAGITNVTAIHRGFHSYEQSIFRNDPKWEIPIEMKRLFPELKIISDPSHICGCTELLPFISQKALDMDMHGLMIETHHDPPSALSDARQQLTPAQLKSMLSKLILRQQNLENKRSIPELELLRNKIDVADDELMEVLKNRMQLAEKIGEFKRRNKITAFQPGRWDKVLHERIRSSRIAGLEENFIRQLYGIIHEESIRKQSAVMNEELQYEKNEL